MSQRTLIIMLVRLALATGLLVVGCTLGLPLIAALPRESGIPLWGSVGPVLGGLAAGGLLIYRNQAIRHGGWPGRAADLPAQVVIVFTGGAIAGIIGGSVLEQDIFMVHRPVVVLLCGPGLAIASGLVLHAMVQPLLVAELARLVPGGLASREGSSRLSGVGVLAIRPSLTLVAGTVVLVALSLVGGHAYCMAQHDQEQRTTTHLIDLLRIASGQLGQLAPPQRREVLARYPASEDAEVLGLDARGRIAAGGVTFGKGRQVVTQPGGRCKVDGVQHPCAVSGRLAVIDPVPVGQTGPTLASLASHFGLLALGFFAFAALLGWAVGHDISRDFRVIVNQLRAMARQDRLDLGRPVTVTSTDEVGQLTEHLGRLRTRLERELDEHQKSLRKVRDADRIKNEFFSSVSHELRTPLATLGGYAQLLLDGSEGELTPSQQEDVRSIHNGGQQLLALVNDVLDISVIESGHLRLIRERVDVAALCGEQVQAQRATLEAQGRSDDVRLDIEVEPGLPLIEADPRRLTQIVQNLLSNALKFTTEGSVDLRASLVELNNRPHIVITVKDTGVGISRVDLPHVFDSYRQVGDLTSRRKGSGLGLAIAKHLVDLHGGAIAVESELEHGSSFTLAIPVSEAAP